MIAMTEQTAQQLQYEQKMAYLDERLVLYRQVIGGWPTNISSEEQEREIRFLWQTDYSHASSLLRDHPHDITVKLVVAELLRMGHNLGIPNAAQHADMLLNEIFRIDEYHLQAMICRASMYVSLHHDLLPDAERLFSKVIELTTPYVPAEAYQGLGFACLHQGKTGEAIVQFDKYLKLVPADGKVKEITERLRAGEKGSSRFYPDPQLSTDTAATETLSASGTVTPSSQQEEAAFKPIKPWWKFW